MDKPKPTSPKQDGDSETKAPKSAPKEAKKEPERNPSANPPLPIKPEMLDALFPINFFGKKDCERFIQDKTTLSLGPGSVLFQQGEPLDSLYYLLEGTVSLYIYDDKICEISADKTDIKYPLCSGKQNSISAYAMTDVQVLRVSPEVMGNKSSEAFTPFDPASPSIPTIVQESRLFQAFCHVYRNEELVIPTLPSITFQLRHALESNDVGVREIAEIVQMDPAIAGKLVQIANSVLYRPWSPFTNCKDAVSHIGLNATRNFVLIQSLRQIFNCRNSRINQLLKEEWKKSIYLSSLCWVLATENGGVDPEEAQLAGLVADIGNVPFLSSLIHIPNEYLTPSDIALVLPYIGPKIGVEVLRSWGFSDSLTGIPLVSENWFSDITPEIILSDIVILSKLHSYMGTPKMSSLPPINSIPAFGKLKDLHLCPEDSLNYSLQVLGSAKEKVKAAESLLGF